MVQKSVRFFASPDTLGHPKNGCHNYAVDLENWIYKVNATYTCILKGVLYCTGSSCICKLLDRVFYAIRVPGYQRSFLMCYSVESLPIIYFLLL